MALERILRDRVIVARATGLREEFGVGIPGLPFTVNFDEVRTREACVTLNRRGKSRNLNKFLWISGPDLDSEEEEERLGHVMMAERKASVDAIQKDCKIMVWRECEEVLAVRDEGIRIESSDL